MRKINQYVLCGFLLITQAVFSFTQNYYLEVNSGDGKAMHNMIVVMNGDNVTVTIIDDKKEKQIVQFKEKIKFQRIEYQNKDGKNFLVVIYDYSNKKIIARGDIISEFSLEENIYDNNGALFYLFSQIFPQKDEIIKFTLLQSKLGKTVDMYLKLVGQEELIIGGKEINALKYEMGLSNKIASVFWPYKYYYWYSATDRKFLRYEGLGENKKLQTTQMVKIIE